MLNALSYASKPVYIGLSLSVAGQCINISTPQTGGGTAREAGREVGDAAEDEEAALAGKLSGFVPFGVLQSRC